MSREGHAVNPLIVETVICSKQYSHLNEYSAQIYIYMYLPQWRSGDNLGKLVLSFAHSAVSLALILSLMCITIYILYGMYKVIEHVLSICEVLASITISSN